MLTIVLIYFGINLLIFVFGVNKSRDVIGFAIELLVVSLFGLPIILFFGIAALIAKIKNK